MPTGLRISFVLAIVLLAFVTRFMGIAEITEHRNDEAMQIPSAKNYISEGHQTPDNWYHPPMRTFMNYASISVFGDNPYGWRLKNVIFGALTALALFLLALEVLPDERAAYLAGLFIALDPLHISISRGSFEEIPMIFFFTMGMYFMVRYMKRGCRGCGILVLASVLLGLAVSTKWYYLPALALLVGFMATTPYRRGGPGWERAIPIVLTMMFIPAIIYLLTFYPWFARGYGFGDFFRMQYDAYRELKIVGEGFNPLLMQSSAWEWFVRPIMYGFELFSQSGFKKLILFTNNPPVLLLALPALGFLGYSAWKEHDRRRMLIPMLFLIIYLPLLMSGRPIFLHSLLILLPFVYVAIAFMLISMASRLPKSEWAHYPLYAGVVLWGLYLYPLATYRTIPAGFYDLILNHANIVRPF